MKYKIYNAESLSAIGTYETMLAVAREINMTPQAVYRGSKMDGVFVTKKYIVIDYRLPQANTYIVMKRLERLLSNPTHTNKVVLAMEKAWQEVTSKIV